MAKNFQEPEENDQDGDVVDHETTGKKNGAQQNGQQQHDFKDPDMLTEQEVIDRSHAKETKTGPRVQEWKPPSYDPKDFDDDDDDDEKDPADNPLANPGLKDQPEDEKQKAGKKAAKGIFEGIDMLLQEAGNLALLFKKRKLEKLEREGEINLELRLHYRNGESETAGEAIERYNEKAYGIIALPQDYKDKGAEIFGPELAKKGIGLTDKQYFLTIETGKVLKKLGKRFAGMYAIKMDILEALKEQTANPNTAFTPPPRPGAYQHEANPQPQTSTDNSSDHPIDHPHDDQPAPVYEPEEVIHADQPGEQVYQQPEDLLKNGQSVEDIQSNRGVGVIVEEQLPREFQPQQNRSNSRRSKTKRNRK